MKVSSVSTGRWGAGMFAKNPKLTFLQQYLAACEANVEYMDYHCFDHENEILEFSDFVKEMKKMGQEKAATKRLRDALFHFSDIEGVHRADILKIVLEYMAK